MGALIEMRDLSFSWPEGRPVFSGLNASIQAGERICLMGRNGSGKSTLFRLLLGLLEPSAGTLFYRAEAYQYRKQWLRNLRQAIGFVFQDPEEQIFAPTVLQEISFGPHNLGLPREEVERRVMTAARQMCLLEMLERPTHLLSFGEKKRVSIAAILVMQPEILLLDEPTAWLDPENQAEITRLLLELNREGTTLIVSSHQLDWAADFAERALLLGQGGLAYDGPMAEALAQPTLLEELGLLISERNRK